MLAYVHHDVARPLKDDLKEDGGRADDAGGHRRAFVAHTVVSVGV